MSREPHNIASEGDSDRSQTHQTKEKAIAFHLQLSGLILPRLSRAIARLAEPSVEFADWRSVSDREIRNATLQTSDRAKALDAMICRGGAIAPV